VKAWDQIDGRELVGYLPWAYGVVGSDKGYDAAWQHLLKADELGGPKGLRTAEPSYRYYMRQYRYDKETGLRECQWNGPIWPFQTTQALMALAAMMHDRGAEAPVARGEYWRLLSQYAAMHRQADGRLDLEEDYEPDSGKPIVGLARSHHYFHSGFNDLVVTGLVGLIPSADDRLVLDPLVAQGEGPDWFALQDLPYHGHLLTVTWDRSGSHFRGQGAEGVSRRAPCRAGIIAGAAGAGRAARGQSRTGASCRSGGAIAARWLAACRGLQRSGAGKAASACRRADQLFPRAAQWLGVGQGQRQRMGQLTFEKPIRPARWNWPSCRARAMPRRVW
jgi:hypothetical protein